MLSLARHFNYQKHFPSKSFVHRNRSVPFSSIDRICSTYGDFSPSNRSFYVHRNRPSHCSRSNIIYRSCSFHGIAKPTVSIHDLRKCFNESNRGLSSSRVVAATPEKVFSIHQCQRMLLFLLTFTPFSGYVGPIAIDPPQWMHCVRL